MQVVESQLNKSCAKSYANKVMQVVESQLNKSDTNKQI